MLVAIATAEPPDEPPHVRVTSNGLPVAPTSRFTVFAPMLTSGTLVLPMTMPPAARIRATIPESATDGTLTVPPRISTEPVKVLLFWMVNVPTPILVREVVPAMANVPLSAITTSADAALRWLGRTPPEVGEAQNSLERIAKDARRAPSSIQSVRAVFSNVKQGGGVQPRTPVDTNELVRESIAILRGELEAAKIIVRLELAKERTLISVDSGQLQQVLLNLITNAADAMRATTDRARVLKVTSSVLETKSVAIRIVV